MSSLKNGDEKAKQTWSNLKKGMSINEFMK